MSAKRILFSFLLFNTSINAYSQESFKDRFFSSWGFSPALDFSTSPMQVEGPVATQTYTGYNNVPYTRPVYVAYQSSYIFFPAFCYEARYNLTEPGDNMAISGKSTPTLSLGSGEPAGLFSFYLPLGIGLELGNGATYQATSNTGFTFTAGYSINVTPLIVSRKISSYKTYGTKMKTLWGCPYVAAGIRYWSKKNRLREISIQYGFGPKHDSLPLGNAEVERVYEGGNFEKSIILRLTWMKYFNY